MLTFKKLRRLVIVSGLLSCGAYVYFLSPTVHNGGLPMAVQPLGSGSSLVDNRPDALMAVEAGAPQEGASQGNALEEGVLRPEKFDEPEGLRKRIRHQGGGGGGMSVQQQAMSFMPSMKPSASGAPDGVRRDQDEAAGSAEDADSDAGMGLKKPAKEPTNPERPWFFQSGSKRPLPGERGECGVMCFPIVTYYVSVLP